MKQIIIDNKTIEISDESFEQLKASLIEPKKWVPKKGGEYWMVCASGRLTMDKWDDHPIDKYRLSTNNVHQTEELAEKHKQWLLAFWRVMNSSDWVPDWEDSEQRKWFIGYNLYRLDSLDTDYSWLAKETILPCYPTEEAAKQAIKTYEKDLKIIFGVEGK